MADRSPSPRRLALRATVLVLPLVLSAVALPRVLRALREARAGPAAAGAPRETGAPAPGESPPPRAGPTSAEIEAARQAAVEAARVQERGWGASQTFAPRPAVRGEDGEVTAPFQGFGVSVESQPPGARLVVGGRDLGETPVVASVDCRPGEEVEVRVERTGFRPHRRQLRCRADALLELTVRLER